MNVYVTKPYEKIQIQISGELAVEISASGKLKVILKDVLNDDYNYDGIAVVFINHSTYLLTNIPEFASLVLENRDKTYFDVYVRRITR